jgi:hypothetical protein
MRPLEAMPIPNISLGSVECFPLNFNKNVNDRRCAFVIFSGPWCRRCKEFALPETATFQPNGDPPRVILKRRS